MQERTSALDEVFQYPSSGLPLPTLWVDIPTIDSGSAPPDGNDEPNLADTDLRSEESRHQRGKDAAAQVRKSFEAGRAQGIEEGRQAERSEQGTRLQDLERGRIEQATALSEQFAHELNQLLEAIEPEVVKLALSIASRILRREAQIDPLFLAGAVRVALGQLAETTSVRLRVPAAAAGLWSETIAYLPNLKKKPNVIADTSMRLGECVVETDMGSADLGVSSQLGEIARGFFDDAAATASQTCAPVDLQGPEVRR